MAIPELTEDLEFIAKLGDNPNTDNNMSSADLKAQFDKASGIIKSFINTYIVPTINNYVSTSGFLPLAGGTMKGVLNMGKNKVTNLSTPTADTDAATKAYVDGIVPGVIPVSKGGTGATTAAAARTNLGAAAESHAHEAEDISSGTLSSSRLPTVPITKGGTGATTVAAARNALGLGNTTGALPVANGGTGATTVAAARNALGLGNTTGALPIANGGTGATNGATGLKNLLAAGYMVASSYQIVSSVDNIPSSAPVNSVFLVPMEE